MRTDEFDFVLPERLIAQHPPEQRGASRLLYAHDGVLENRRFAELLQLVRLGDVLVLNDTRVINARLFGSKESGGKVEVLVERVLNEHEVLAQVRASHCLLYTSGKVQHRGALLEKLEAVAVDHAHADDNQDRGERRHRHPGY